VTTKPFSILSTKVLHQGRKFRFVEEEMWLPTGRTSRIEKLEHPGAVVILPRHANGNFVLVEQFRPAVRETLIEFPAGTLELGEQPLECAKRELMEEIGFAGSDWISLGSLYPAPGFCNEVQHFFAATGLTPQSLPQDDDEIIEPLELDLAALQLAIRENKVRDGKSLAIFAMACAKGIV
jgi:ADP-ribose pyrophosphatase